jgi:hypothetical protein
MKRRTIIGTLYLTVCAASLCLAILCPSGVLAHCDTVDGPVVLDAKRALEKGDATPVLKWVKKEDESEVKTALEKTLKVRNQGHDVRDLADFYFFETVVRLHRASEAAPYNGLKPAGTDPGFAAREGDKALKSGNVDHVVGAITQKISQEIRDRFHRAAENMKHSDDTVEAGRVYVKSYVDFVHLVEHLDDIVSGTSSQRPAEPHAGAEHKH